MAPHTRPAPVRLQFKQSLTAHGLAHAELLRRLRLLHHELADLDQDRIVPASLDTVARECIAPPLLLHPQPAVRAYLACCLADILRLYAPAAPFTDHQLKDLFQFLFRQLKHLANPADPHFAQYFYLVESLSNVKSIVLVCDLDAADDLMPDLFRHAFDLISSSSPKNVQLVLADLLSQVLDEAAALPAPVVDLLLAQFLPQALAARPAAHALAVRVCQASADKLQRYVCQYFGEVITRASGPGPGPGPPQSDDDDDDDDASEEEEGHRHGQGHKGGKKKRDMAASLPNSVVVAHALIQQLHRTVPLVLLNVVPQLEEELVTDRAPYRLLATRALGAMLADPPSGAGAGTVDGGLAAQYPATWREWLKRSKDREPAVRTAVVDALPRIWLEHPELGPDIEVVIRILLTDLDDKVRVAACTVFAALDYETAATHVPRPVLALLGDRCKDKKGAVRAVAFHALGRLYHLAFPDIERADERAIDHFAWIPGTILTCLEVLDPAVRTTVNAIVLQYIVPLPKKDDDNEAAWVDRLLVVLKHLSEKEERELVALTRLSERRPGVFDQFINNCEKHNGGVIDKDAERIKAQLKANIKFLAQSGRFPDPTRATDDMGKFAKANEKQLYKLLRVLVDPQTDLKVLLKSYKDCLKRLEQVSPAIVDTFTLALRSFAYLIVNRSSVPTLLKRAAGGASAPAVRILTHVAKLQPALFKAHVAELTKALAPGAPDDVATVALHALSRLAKADSAVSPDKKLAERAKHYARTGTPNQAKYAATIIALDSARPGAADDLVDFLADDLPDASDADLVARLAALNRLARWAREAFENKSEQITASVLEILQRGTVPGEMVDDPELEWVLDEDVDDLTRARILSVKVLTSRCLAYAGTDSAAQAAVPVFQLLWPLLHAHEEDSKFAQPVAARLRLASALAILKLAATEQFNTQIFERFDVLAQAAQDTCYEVRSTFINRLLAHLRTGSIKHARFNMILFLVAHDPEQEIRDQVSTYVRSRHPRLPVELRQPQWEHPFVRLLHLLAHHPDFAGEEHDAQTIAGMAKYITFYIDTIVSGDNIPYIYHLALRLKTVRDSESADFDTNLYILSELSQHLLKQHAAAHSWPIPTHPESAKLPSDIFRPMTSEDVSRVVKKSYLSADVIAELPAVKGRAVKVKQRRTPTEPKARKSPKSRATKSKRAPKKKAATWHSGSEDESDAPSAGNSDSEDDGAPPPVPRKRGAPKERTATSPVAAKKARQFVEAKASDAKVDKEAASPKGKGNKAAKKPASAKMPAKERTRGVIKGLGKPRPLARKENEALSDLSSDGGMEVD